tara:strand:+ start:608 stop:712 length:105 start_codon:yes stop_codon:yes gene_type:complete
MKLQELENRFEMSMTTEAPSVVFNEFGEVVAIIK